MTDLVLFAADQQLPEDVGKAGPIGALLTVLLFIAILLLVKSMTTHLKRVPRSFDPADEGPRFVVPDTPAELVDPRPEPGQDLLDTLRRAPRAIEGPRRDDGRPDASEG
jgi:hypothetical protein